MDQFRQTTHFRRKWTLPNTAASLTSKVNNTFSKKRVLTVFPLTSLLAIQTFPEFFAEFIGVCQLKQRPVPEEDRQTDGKAYQVARQTGRETDGAMDTRTGAYADRQYRQKEKQTDSAGSMRNRQTSTTQTSDVCTMCSVRSLYLLNSAPPAGSLGGSPPPVGIECNRNNFKWAITE